MTTSSSISTFRIYTNDLERERLREDAYSRTSNRLSLNRHRIRRAGPRQLTVIAIVARERGDQTVYNECRDLLALVPGQKLDETYEIIESRRPARNCRHGFASNRVVRFEIEDIAPQSGLPLPERKAMIAATEIVRGIRGHLV